MGQEKEYKPQPRRHGPMGHGPMGSGEKAKDFKGSFQKLLVYMGRYKIAIFFVMILAAVSTVFSVAGPKVMANATNALFDGLMRKVAGTGGIDFDYIAKVLLFTLALYLFSSVVSFFQGWVMMSVSQKICYRIRKEISEKINRIDRKSTRLNSSHS